MKTLALILITMSTLNLSAQNGKAATVKNTFNRQTSISIKIKSDASTVWGILTNGSDFSRWNSTITLFEGDIVLGGKIRLISTLDEKRMFKLKVKEFESEKKLVWGDGKGDRVYTISQNNDNTVTFSMTEKIGGLMFPMYAKYIPPFDESFEQFADDLKKEAELIFNSKN